MTPLFFYGTLCHAPLLRLVLDREAETTPARLDGYQVRWAAGESFPILREAEAGQIDGILLRDATSEDRARLDHYEGAFDYAVLPVSVETEAGVEAAEVYRPQPGRWPVGQAWDLQDWVRDWGALTLEAAEEVMAHYGRPEAAGLGRRFHMVRSRAQSRLRAADWDRSRTISSDFSAEDVALEGFSRPYLGFFTLEEHRLRHRRFDGSWTDPADRAVFRAADAVTVLPYDPVRDAVLLIEQLRVAAYAHGDPHPWLIEPIAGIVDAGETYEMTARREAEEEAGISIGALHQIGRYYPSPGAVAQVLISYLGITDLPDDLPGQGGLQSEGEDIRSIRVSFDQAMEMVQSGEIAVAPLIISLQWLALNRDRLRGRTVTA